MTSIVQVFAAILFSFSGCSPSDKIDHYAEAVPLNDSSKVLIVYLSRTSNTKVVAEIIQKNVGGTLVELELEKPYPENYRETVAQVVRENDTGYLPPLKTKINDLESFDIVFIGFPTWGMKLPPPMKSFLSSNNLSGKTVVPFNTNGGYGPGSTFETVASLCLQCEVLEGYTTNGGEEIRGVMLDITGQRKTEVERSVKQWLQKNSLFP